MYRPNVLCLVIDGLRPDFLGAYGNSICATPAFDALASESVVFDFAFCQSTDPSSFYQHAVEGERSIIRVARESGFRTALFTDDAQVCSPPATSHFSDVFVLPNRSEDGPMIKAANCRAVQLLATGAESIRQFGEVAAVGASPEPWLTWVHCSALTTAWDAPLGPFFDTEPADRPRIDNLTAVPGTLGCNIGAEDVEVIRERYADQVEALDCGLQLLLESLAESEQFQNTHVLLVGLRGFPLGEHDQFGFSSASLFEELIHVPVLIHAPGGRGRMTRSIRLTSTADILSTISDLCDRRDGLVAPPTGKSLLPLLRGDQVTWRDALRFENSDGERAIRTRDWYLRMPFTKPADQNTEDESLAAELYSKPDDRWDVNEIGSRCEDVVAEMVERLG